MGGQPGTDQSDRPERDGDPAKIFTANTALEDGAISAYNSFLLICRDNGDSESARLFQDIIADEQIHFNYFDNVRKHIEQLGQTYLAQVAGTSSATGIVYQGFVDRQEAQYVPGGGGGA